MSTSSLITWTNCKKILELDERDKEVIELLIFSVSVEIELYTDRNLYEKEIREHHDAYNQREITLKQYPVKEILKLFCDRKRKYTETYLIDPQYYTCSIPEEGDITDQRTEIILEDGYTFPRGRKTILVNYRAGYKPEEMPENIKIAAIEMVDWSLKRIRGGQIGAKELTGRNSKLDKTMYEDTMPPHVKDLLGPFKRKRW
jgi:hypothetical protein